MSVDANDLQLFLTKKGNGNGVKWLTQLDVVKGVMDANGFTHLQFVDAKLRDVGLESSQLGKVNDKDVAVGKGHVHVLVMLPALFSQWDPAPGQFPPLEFEDKGHVISIPAAYAENSGIPAKNDGLMLYLRNGVHEEWNALLTSVVDTYAQLWIVGPPGTGKSLAAFAFACKLKRVDGDLGGDWDVVWISCPKGYGSQLRCILFRGENKKLTCSILAKDLKKLLKTLPDHTILFLDGFATGPDNDKTASVNLCVDWRSQNKPLRRLVIVTSMVSLGKHSKFGIHPEIPSTGVRDEVRFDMYSWTLSEYKESLTHANFCTHVKKMFDVDDLTSVSPDRRDELAEEKYYVAGGNARMMFDYSTKEAKTALNEALDGIDNVLKYMEGMIGTESSQMLIALLPPKLGTYEPKRRLVSSFVAKKISLRVGPQRLQALAKSLAWNPAMDGHMLEMWFFSCLTHVGVQCYKLEGRTICEIEKWPKSDVNSFDPESNDAIDLVYPQMWFEPLKWNNGGFDGVFVDYQDAADTDTTAKQAGYRYKLHVRFVQVTRAEKHSYKTKFFRHLLSRFKTHMGNSLWISRVEVCFVVPIKIVKTFTIPVKEEDFRKDVVDPVIEWRSQYDADSGQLYRGLYGCFDLCGRVKIRLA
ncbi:hypothetical protein DVH05_016538 [Phytophthora capsici]|nr:hypothetical protein DVH05_016538 [Phytophthora capsici]